MKNNSVIIIIFCFAFIGSWSFNAAQGSANLHSGTKAIQTLDETYARQPDHDKSLQFHELVRTGKGSLGGHNFTGIDYTYHATEDDRRIIYRTLIRSTLYPKDRTKEQQVDFLNEYLLTLFGVCIDKSQHFEDDYYHQLTTFVVSFLATTKDQPQRPEFYKFVQGFSNDVHHDTQLIDKIVDSMPGVRRRTNNQQALEDYVKSIENSAAFKEAYAEVEGKKPGSSGGSKTSAEVQQRLDFLRRDLSELNDILLTHKDMKAKGTAVYKRNVRNFDDQIDRNTADKIKIEKEIKDLEASLLFPNAHAPASAYSAAAAAAQLSVLLRKEPDPSSSSSSNARATGNQVYRKNISLFQISFDKENNRLSNLKEKDGLGYVTMTMEPRTMPRSMVMGTYEFDELNPFDYALTVEVPNPASNSLPGPIQEVISDPRLTGYKFRLFINSTTLPESVVSNLKDKESIKDGFKATGIINGWAQNNKIPMIRPHHFFWNAKAMDEATKGKTQFIDNMEVGVFDADRQITFIPYAQSLTETENDKRRNKYGRLNLFTFKTGGDDDSSISIHQGVNGPALSPSTMGILGLNHDKSAFFYTIAIIPNSNEIVATAQFILNSSDNEKLRKSIRDLKAYESTSLPENLNLPVSMKQEMHYLFGNAPRS